jgi:hypothetical protein
VTTKKTRGASGAGTKTDLAHQLRRASATLLSKPVALKVDAKVVSGNTVLTYPDHSTLTLIGVTDISGGIFA